jgi:hypothetical protein
VEGDVITSDSTTLTGSKGRGVERTKRIKRIKRIKRHKEEEARDVSLLYCTSLAVFQ